MSYQCGLVDTERRYVPEKLSSCPYLLLYLDPLMSECLIYQLKPGQTMVCINLCKCKFDVHVIHVVSYRLAD